MHILCVCSASLWSSRRKERGQKKPNSIVCGKQIMQLIIEIKSHEPNKEVLAKKNWPRMKQEHIKQFVRMQWCVFSKRRNKLQSRDAEIGIGGWWKPIKILELNAQYAPVFMCLQYSWWNWCPNQNVSNIIHRKIMKSI